MLHRFFITIMGVCSLALGAQEVKFGEINLEDLNATEYINDTEANAVILYKKVNSYFITNGGNSRLVTEVHERIKIFNKDGFEHATKEISLYKNRSSEETVSKLKALTFNLIDGKAVETELDKENIFKTEASYYYNKVNFTMPNVQEGSILDITYRLNSPFIWNIDSFVFQYEIPVKQLVAEIRTPKGFNFKKTPKGEFFVYPKVSTATDHRIGMDVVKTAYHLNNVPALKEEKYVDNIDNYRSGVLFELVSVDLPGYFRSYSQSWADVAKTIGNTDDYKNELDKTRAFDDELDAVLSGLPSKKDKMDGIFKYVKDQLTWNEMDGKYFFNGLKKTWKEKKGNAADINLSLVAMLRYAGLNANPVLISTKDNRVPYFPTVDGLNYVIAYVKLDGTDYFLDATHEFSDVNILPIRDYNWRGILINNPDKVWRIVDLKQPKKAVKMFVLDAIVHDDGTTDGTVKARLSNHFAMNFREEFKNLDEEEYVADLEVKYGNIEISEHSVQKLKDFKGGVTEEFKFYDEEGAEMMNGKLFLKPLEFLTMEENPFKTEKRQYPVDFGFPFKNSFMVNYTLPEGYTVESVPEGLRMKIPGDLGTFTYMVKVTASKLNILVNYEINQSIVYPENYDFLKEFYKQIITKEAEPLVLSKITNGNSQSTTGGR
ncbi:Transglutaminase domain-containing protein [Croceitalea dokdonensis DOKDO 023]|uniref:Transglutaminase domain-containing protein n=1 Tax=Croceitalea dokdonensis DOKDO 023 TaxID=1300341 RepID=A0A0P7AV09_9FLAO|nr:DUF3857 domain-containing protein [Croceitalea dokdonensis]KPM32392.1 Transglutaminase domain-containing protein [Croceitalea dokdonensis DOKDO 023]